MSLSGPLIWLGILQAVIYLLFIRAIDLYEREPLRYVIPVFIWGFAVATTVSLVFNTLFQLTLSSVTSVKTASFFTAVVEAPVVEECTKGAALLLIFFISYLARRRSGLVEFAGVMDGIVYGSAVGFGFSIAEDLLYGLQFGPETYIVRRIFGGFAHASFTSLTGIGIGLIPLVDNRALKVILPVLGLSGAILLHCCLQLYGHGVRACGLPGVILRYPRLHRCHLSCGSPSSGALSGTNSGMRCGPGR